jgi:hypothetical protein
MNQVNMNAEEQPENIDTAIENNPVVRTIGTEQQVGVVQRIGGTTGEQFAKKPKMTARNMDVFYGDKQALFDVSIDLGKDEVLAPHPLAVQSLSYEPLDYSL